MSGRRRRALVTLLALGLSITGCREEVACPSCDEVDWQVVAGADDPAVDLAAVQAAVDWGGVVLLTGTFDFGEDDDAQVRISTDVVVRGDLDADGSPRTVIKNGVTPFFCDDPEVAVRLEGLQFGRDASRLGTANAAGPAHRAVHIRQARRVVLANNRIASLRSRPDYIAGVGPIGVGVGFMIGAAEGALNPFEEVQIVSNRMDLGMYEDTGAGVALVSTTIYRPDRAPAMAYPTRYPDGWPDLESSQTFFGVTLYRVDGTFLVYGNAIRNTNGGGIYVVDASGESAAAPARVVVANNRLSSGPFAGLQHGDEQYRGIFVEGGALADPSRVNFDVTVEDNHIAVEARAGYGVFTLGAGMVTARHNHVSVAQQNTDGVGWHGTALNVGLWFWGAHGFEDISLNTVEGDGDAGIRVMDSTGNRFFDNVFVGLEGGPHYYFDPSSYGNIMRGAALTADDVYDPLGNNDIVEP